jgi:hypothetical protein
VKKVSRFVEQRIDQRLLELTSMIAELEAWEPVYIEDEWLSDSLEPLQKAIRLLNDARDQLEGVKLFI